MKSISVAAAAALLAGLTSAQPARHHGHQHLHAKRDLVTEWETVWETVTVLVDESTTETLYPAHTESGAPGEFYETPSTTTSTPEPTPTVAEVSTSTQAPPPPPTTTTVQSTTSSSSSSTPAPAPTTTSIPEPEPEPTTSEVAAPATTTAASVETTPVDTPSTGGGSGGDTSYAGPDGAFGTSSMDSEDYAGKITYYDPALGTCGYTDGEDSVIVAISVADWQARGSGTSLGLGQPNHPWCNQMITITAADGTTTTAKVRDTCPSCPSGSIDVSRPVFMALYGSLDAGHAQVTWDFS